MWEGLKEAMSFSLLGIEMWQLLVAFLAVLAGFILKQLVPALFRRVQKLAAKTATSFDDILLESIIPPLGWFCVLIGVYIAIDVLPIPEEPVNILYFLKALAKGISVVLFIWFAIRLSDKLCDHWAQKAADTDTKIDDQAIPIIQRTLRVFLILVGVTLFLQNLGYSIGSLVAGLGIGGAALALASKDTLSNLFGAIVIFWDRPFAVGDWIVVGDVEGVVEGVGLRTTRVRTFAKSLITVPNAKFTTSAINNWSKMPRRRVKMTVGLTYDTKPAQMEAAVNAVRDSIKANEAIHNDFYLVNFDKLGDSSLEIFIYCFTVTTNWAEFLEVKQQLLLDIMKRVDALGLDFAFPTTSVHVESMPGEPKALTAERPE